MSKDELLATLNQLYVNDPYVNELFNAAGIELDKLQDTATSWLLDLYFNTCSAEQLKKYEMLAGINAKQTQTLADRRQNLIAKWRSEGKSTLQIIQDVANSWKNGECTVSFINGKITLTFNSSYGVPDDLGSLLSAIDDVKPAHLAISYILKYLLIENVVEFTVNELQEQEIYKFAFNERS